MLGVAAAGAAAFGLCCAATGPEELAAPQEQQPQAQLELLLPQPRQTHLVQPQPHDSPAVPPMMPSAAAVRLCAARHLSARDVASVMQVCAGWRAGLERGLVAIALAGAQVIMSSSHRCSRLTP
jgi:hypothetical protein